MCHRPGFPVSAPPAKQKRRKLLAQASDRSRTKGRAVVLPATGTPTLQAQPSGGHGSHTQGACRSLSQRSHWSQGDGCTAGGFLSEGQEMARVRDVPCQRAEWSGDFHPLFPALYLDAATGPRANVIDREGLCDSPLGRCRTFGISFEYSTEKYEC